MEREFIHGNHDGPHRENETYTICRVRVDRSTLKDEIALGLHPQIDLPLVDAHPKKWTCKAETAGGFSRPKTTALATTIPGGADKAAEFVFRNAGDHGTYTICRIGVPRKTVVEEIEKHLHRDFHLTTVQGIRYPRRNANSGKILGKPWYCNGSPRHCFGCNVALP